MASLRSSLDLFDDAGIANLIKKSKILTSYMEFLINSLDSDIIKIITPNNSDSRGSQLSIMIDRNEKSVNDVFVSNNILCDFRKPNIVRAAPCAFYNTFSDIYNFVEVLKKL